jgi:hypothetical protein
MTPRRSHLSLDGPWDFELAGRGGSRTIAVPGPWQAQFPDLRGASGMAHYRRRFALPADWHGREVAVRFGAVNYFCRVRLNGVSIGEHEGGYLPFEFVLPAGTLKPENDLDVDVVLPTSDGAAYPEWPLTEVPHGKQSWYGPIGGIWQSVALEARDRRHIRHIAISAALSGIVHADVMLSSGPADAMLRGEIIDPKGRRVVGGYWDLDGAQALLHLDVPRPRPWSPDSPNVYKLCIELWIDGTIVDVVTETFGFRTIEARDGKLFLNGEPLYLRGALDQDYYPAGIATPPSTAFLKDQVRKAKALGLNCLRCHIKVPDPRYLEVADRLGMLVWCELPSVGQFTPASARRMRETLAGMLDRDGNHPSIIAWTIINEDWGTRLVEDADHRLWLRETYEWLKAQDPSFLVVDNSACNPNFHVRTDINDFHYYRSLPERRAEWDKLTEEFAGRPAWTFSPHGDAVETGKEPLIVSEFGTWGLPRPRALAEVDGSEPWWLETGGFWGEGAAYPHGVEGRFATLHLDRTFGSFDRFIEDVQWHQFRNLKYQIESIRARASIAGYVITEFTDVHWEANGLLDMARNPRVFHDRFGAINADTVIVPLLDRYSAWRGGSIRIRLVLATGRDPIPAGSHLVWALEGQSGTIELGPILPSSAAVVSELAIDVPPAGGSTSASIAFRLDGPDGAQLASNTADLVLFARRTEPMASVHCADEEMAARLAGLGYRLAGPDQAPVTVARAIDADMVEAIRTGRHCLLLVDGTSRATLRSDPLPREQPFMAIVDADPGMPAAPHHFFPGLGVVDRQRTMWRGDWISTFGWLRRTGAFATVPGGPIHDLAFDRVVPRLVLTGFQSWEYEARVHAGVIVGWVHKPAVTIGERSFGKGKLAVTTFRLCEDAPGADPLATTLFDALIETAGSRGL